jgi:hypothetical protein
MAYTEDELKEAARKAMAAGDTAAAQRLIAAARKAGAEQAASPWTESAAAKTGQGRFLTGAVAPVAEAGLGAAQWAGKALGADSLVEGSQRAVDAVRAARERAGGFGTAGEIASLALPGGAVAKGLTKLPKIGALLARSPVAAGAAAGATEGAGYELLRPDTPGTSRADRVATAASVGAAGGAAGPTLARTLGGPLGAPSQDVQGTLKRAEGQGVSLPLTTGQMMSGRQDMPARFVRSIEEGLTALPGSRARARRDRAALAWNQADLKEAAGNPQLAAQVTEGGDAGLRQLQLAREDLYDRALGSQPLVAAAPTARAGALINRLPPTTADEARALLASVSDDFTSGNMTPQRAKELISSVRKKASQAYGSGDYTAGEAYEAIHKDLMDNLRTAIGPQRAALLDQADQLHARLVPREEAAQMVGARRRGLSGAYTPDQLGGRIVANAPRGPAATGRAPGQAATEQAGRAFGSSIPPVGPGTAEKLSASTLTGGLAAAAGAGSGSLPVAALAAGAPYGIDALLASPGIARAMTGMTAAQKAQFTQQLIEALRSGSAMGAGAGAALGGFDYAP